VTEKDHLKHGLIGDDGEALRLYAYSREHAIVAKLLCTGELEWFRHYSVLAYDGIPYSTELDEWGVPKLTAQLRALLGAPERP